MTDQIFFITSMPDSRPADYYLGYMDGCVFIDFDNCADNQICLKRISFDGYGCCNLKEATPLSVNESLTFKNIIRDQVRDQETLLHLVKRAVDLNKAQIWTDALEEYSLT